MVSVEGCRLNEACRGAIARVLAAAATAQRFNNHASEQEGVWYLSTSVTTSCVSCSRATRLI